MQEQIKSEGKCLFCSKTFAKAGINRHLATHLKEKVKTGKKGLSFLLKVETNKRWGSTPYFLSLWVDGEATMKTIDDFLRAIWLDCCGHLSAFTDPNNRRPFGWDFFEATELKEKGNAGEYDQLMEDETGEISMSRKVKKALYEGLVLNYVYDFGDSTELTITVMNEYPVKADENIVLLSRNEPLHMMCFVCRKVPATQMCMTCMTNGEAYFCDRCAQKHEKECEEFADYASMPIVNSPRTGVCGYTGGVIDTERDGVYRM